MARLPLVGQDNDTWGTVLNNYLEVSHTGGGKNKPLVTSVDYASSITPDIDTTEILTIGALTGDITIVNPTGTPIDGQILTLRLLQDGTGLHTVVFGTVYSFETTTTPALPVEANSRFEMTFRYNTTTVKWEYTKISESLSPPITMDTTVSFAKPVTVYTPITLTSDKTLTPDTTTKLPGGGAVWRVVGDGTHMITFSGFATGGAIFDKTLNIVNLITFIYDGVDYWYDIALKE
jgi:hypothetical protein